MPRFCLDIHKVLPYGSFHDEGYKAYWGVYHNAVDYEAVFVRVYAWTKLFIDREYWGAEGGNWLECHDEKGNYFRLAHLKEYAVSAGQWVTEGMVIAITGDTGKRVNAAGVVVKYAPHLHFEWRLNGIRSDAEVYFNQLTATPMPENHAFDNKLIRLAPGLNYALVIRGKKWEFPHDDETLAFILVMEKTGILTVPHVTQADWDSLPLSDGLKF